ncbi:MAG: nucleotidyltransferase domain-containing protein [bacterium]
MLLSFDTYKLVENCRKNEVAITGVLGPIVRGTATEQSDLDLLVDFYQRKSLLALVKLERELLKA